MKKRNWTPDWFLKSVLDMHINAMVNRYSCLRVIRQDLFYQKIPLNITIRIISRWSLMSGI
ncbi:hypothetical protein [Klebsiella pneumoniae]|uniref:hypothetical protein n=1 Tax=Klebsiella pneumoniae TaxID=573 RepID=UPI0038D0D6B4